MSSDPESELANLLYYPFQSRESASLLRLSLLPHGCSALEVTLAGKLLFCNSCSIGREYLFNQWKYLSSLTFSSTTQYGPQTSLNELAGRSSCIFYFLLILFKSCEGFGAQISNITVHQQNRIYQVVLMNEYIDQIINFDLNIWPFVLYMVLIKCSSLEKIQKFQLSNIF